MQDIADQLGLSKMTVSKALRGTANVSQKTRQKVVQKALEMGYRPNPLIASLMQQVRERRLTKSTIPVAYVISDPSHRGMAETNAYIAGFRDRATELSLSVEVFCRSDFASAPEFGNVMFARGIRGLACGPCDDASLWEDFPWDKFSSISAGLGHVRLPNTLVRRNISQAVRLLGKHLLNAGLRRPAILYSPQPDSELDRITEGALYMLIKYGCGDFSLIRPAGSPAELRAWLATSSPDVIVLHYPPHMALLQQAGFSLSGPLPIVSLKADASAGLPGIYHQPYNIGYAAADLLSHEIRVNRTGLQPLPPTLMIDCTWSDDGRPCAAAINSPALAEPLASPAQ